MSVSPTPKIPRHDYMVTLRLPLSAFGAVPLHKVIAEAAAIATLAMCGRYGRPGGPDEQLPSIEGRVQFGEILGLSVDCVESESG